MNSRQVNEQLLWKSALILTIAGIVTKILSAAYRIPFQNIVGDIGFYIYQQVYPFYGIALILSTYGFPVIISMVIAEHIDANNINIKKVILTSFFALTIVFTLVFISIFLGAERIARLMGDIELVFPIKVVSFSFLFVPILSILRGFFQGQNNMTPTAISQIGEQSVRVATILIFTYLLFVNGFSNYTGIAGAVFGSITGMLCSSTILIYFLLKTKYGAIIRSPNLNNSRLLKTSSIVKVIIGQGFIICISSMFLVLLQLVDAMTLFSQLVKSGDYSIAEAKVVKGVYDRGQPLIQLGTVVATSLSLTMVPLISSALARNDFSLIKEKVRLAIRISVIVGLGATVGLISIIRPTNIMLFKTIDGSTVLSVLAITILFSSVTMTATAIIQGMGTSLTPALYVGIGVGSKVFLNYLLIPHFGTIGAAVATVMAFAITTFLMIRLLTVKLAVPLFILKYAKSALLAGLSMAIILYIYELLIYIILPLEATNRLFATIHSLSGVLVGGAIYIFIIIRRNVFSQHELTALPFGRKLLRIGKSSTTI
ncbi:putative polysaccharide biosynthesis protein [Calidifontibacillus oryziterrae]|uniref:putative polysaccharide biosynthesis protein n=1 Tax=Calidifontibacillus oryziterrae TaxID=1191699 RepID=UPI0002D29A12|nr:polysaccharide biosynthesis protein [Calidifontibacillus oryziterrae]